MTATTPKVAPTGRAGVYVHVPFCLRHCPYCDFAVVVTRSIPHEAYRDAVLRELQDRAAALEGRSVRTLYFGGGTPGLWDPAAIGAVVDAVRALPGAALEEVTIELNPERTEPARLTALRRAGVTRVSLGVQSFDDASLAVLGRLHDGAGAIGAIERVVDAGFAHLSVDLIVGAPGVDPGAPVQDARRVASMRGVDHVSTYDLTWEPGTAYEARRARGRLEAWSDDALADASDAVDDALASGGFARYEVSNHARPGGHAVHNAAYWVGDEYLGLGVGAHSLCVADRIERRANGRHPGRYLDDPHADAAVDVVAAQTHLAELAMTGLRTAQGIDLGDLHRRFGARAAAVDAWARDAMRRGQVRREGGRVVPTTHGLRFADALALDVLHRVDDTPTCTPGDGA